ncbi:hypothetical protein COU76_04030 [Candidatus Peregrinibacteria bacterium CG10_big_fil_rev_8_21_14_0_10_49_10]|nr:MAG: hypothetical protein COU76_04030 [Candidatus Peregrinibacteria bacterium CG10_big_fil_rev_8_21_14_0_10_49_10]
MSVAILERDTGRNEMESLRSKEEACRKKIVALRGGLRTLFQEKGTIMSAGVSNADLMNAVAQLKGQPRSQRSERLDTSWGEEYQSLVQQVNTLLDSAFTADSDPEVILQEIRSTNTETISGL